MTPIQTTLPLAPPPDKTLAAPGYLPYTVEIYLPGRPRPSAPSWCSGKYTASHSQINPGVFPGTWTEPPLPQMHLPLSHIYQTLSPLISRITPLPSITSASLLLCLTWPYVCVSTARPLEYQFHSMCTAVVVMVPPVVCLLWNSSACTWSVRRVFPGCAHLPDTSPPGMLKMSGKVGMTPHTSLTPLLQFKPHESVS